MTVVSVLLGAAVKVGVGSSQGRRRRYGRSGERRTTFSAECVVCPITFLPYQPLLSCLPVI